MKKEGLSMLFIVLDEIVNNGPHSHITTEADWEFFKYSQFCMKV